ncbi:hypothetical protein GYMLUDRAFT_958437 [Collybiopsis luxurians FD-317 M1]|nr:hypothetical protein GYMLUDRAFT_958437 [Collybiopsis luxurians FD-317 M1]
MSDLADAFILSASWVNMMFYGTELVLCGFYFLKSRPRGFYRWSLISALTIDTACTGIICYDVYYSLVVNPQVLITVGQPWMLPAIILCTYHVAMVEQVFFTYRYWQLTRKKIITMMVSALLFSHVAFAWILGIVLMVNPRVTTFSLDLTTIAATLCAATDLVIAVVMFRAMRSINTTYTATKNLLHRISIQSVACGVTTSISTIVMLSLLVTHNLNPFVLVFYSLGRLYTLTILVNYIMLRKPVAQAKTTNGDPSSTRSRAMVFRGIDIPRTFTVPMELSVIQEAQPSHNCDSGNSKTDHLAVDGFSGSIHKTSITESQTQSLPGASIDSHVNN